MRTIVVLASAVVALASGTGAANAGGGSGELRLIALPPSATAPMPQFMHVDAAGKEIIVTENGPHVWLWRDGLNAATPRAQDVDPTNCGDLAGVADVAVTTDRTFYVVDDCLPAAAGELEWSNSGTGWNPALHGVGRPVDVDNDAGYLSTASHKPHTLYFVSHDLAGPGGVACAVIFRRSTDGGLSWSTPVYVNAPPNYPAAQRAAVTNLDGPDLYTQAVVDPRNPRHLTVAWTAESVGDEVQDHADDTFDHYEWDTSAHVANSYDGGQTWHAQTILNTGQHAPGTPHSAFNDIAGWQPSLVADSRGTMYLGFTEMFAGTKVWQPRVMRSLDGGLRWSRPTGLPHRGSTFASSLAVWHDQLIAGWFSSSTKDAGDPKSRWTLQLSRYSWPRAGRARLVATTRTPVLHVGVEQPIGSGKDPSHDVVDLAVDGNQVLAPTVVGDGAKAKPYLAVWQL